MVPSFSNALQNPDADIKRMFPESTSFRMRDLTPARHAKKSLFEVIEHHLHAPLDKHYETAETPHSFYIVQCGETICGYVHGNNVSGEKGLLEVFIAFEKDYRIRDVYVQKMTSADASAFRSEFYLKQFRGLGVKNLPDIARIQPPVRKPSLATIADHQNFVQAVTANILFFQYLFLTFKEGS